MSELHVYHDDYDWIIAESQLDARNIQAENVGDEATPEIGWRREPDDKPMTIVDDGIGTKETMTFAGWIVKYGRGILCSTEW